MRCLVVDDESLARQRLVRMLVQLEGWEPCGEAADGRDALRQVQRLAPDAVLMDIRMPGMDGLEAAQHLCALPRPPAVIFTTAYGDHALAAFDAQALDYLLKPIHPDRLRRALEKAARFSAAAGAALERLKEVGGRSHLCARVRGSLELVPIDEVVFLQADNKYVTVRSPEQEILIEESLKSLEHEFADRFIRVHRSTLIAVRALRGLEKDGAGRFRVVLAGVEEHLEVSRRLLPEIRRRLKAGN